VSGSGQVSGWLLEHSGVRALRRLGLGPFRAQRTSSPYSTNGIRRCRVRPDSSWRHAEWLDEVCE